MFVEGSKAIYCLGDKEEIVDIIKIHPDSITIFIPSIQRERDTLPEKLKSIEEEKKFVLELPEKEQLNIDLLYIGSSRRLNKTTTTKNLMSELKTDRATINVSQPPENITNIGQLYGCKFHVDYYLDFVSELYKEVVNLENRDKVLLENEKLLIEQVNSLQETVKNLKTKDEQRDSEIHDLKLMLKSQKLIHDLELKELRKLLNK